MRTVYARTLRLPRFFRNLLVGTIMLGLNTAVLFGWVAVGLSADAAFWAKIPIAWPLHYWLHRTITWHDRRHDSILKQSRRYVMQKVLTTAFNFLLFKWLLLLGWHFGWAQVFSFVVIGSAQYIINNKAVFLNAKEQAIA